ncbi:hypothetical protein LCGC14_2321820 [marine sediment metagenome]|uniref:Uncharacterized protein n=1 Tax=marine sediment metagenome TaxID=412755 RepID=A0A0F9EV27_9ZZZZ
MEDENPYSCDMCNDLDKDNIALTEYANEQSKQLYLAREIINDILVQCRSSEFITVRAKRVELDRRILTATKKYGWLLV